MRKALAGLAAAMFFAGLAGCSGGGGGGGGGGGASAGGDTPLTYTGILSAANLSATNAASITANVVGSGDVSQAISLAAVAPDSGTIDIGRVLQRSVRAILARPGTRKFTSAIPFDDSFDCDTGSVHVFGTLNDSGTGTLQVQYNACQTGDVTASGSGSLRVNVFDFGSEVPTDFAINFVRLTLSGSVVGEVSGTLATRFDLSASTVTTTENLVARFGSGTMTKSEDLRYDDVINASSIVESVKGRVFHSVHGYVDITTVLPFVFPFPTQDFPQSGQLLLTGASGASVLVTALSPTAVRLSLDIDGVPGFERVVTMMWTDLGGPAGANLADTDGDGMHDSWELAYGMNPNDPADAFLDRDGDGGSNLAEYRNATNPNSANSKPPPVGLSIVASDLGDPVAVGENLIYTITVSNSGPNPANDVVLVDTLPARANLIFASTSQGSCNGATPTLTCNLGTMGVSTSVTVGITISPTAPGPLTNVATVRTSDLDPVVTDNTATTASTAGQAMSVIQAMMSAAAEGDTVLVPPGLYVGNLTFSGRNVHLRSSQGPALTILQGTNFNTAVNIGPLGSIQGFTFSRGQSTGFAISVIGSGTVISGNVFDGIDSPAISGFSASPTIESNVFRNHLCPDQFVTGVVVFNNKSSPRIINNVFTNNTCRAIDLSLAQPNAPQVINNTFVGNRVAIHVDRRVPQVTQIYRNNILVDNGIGLEVVFGTDADNPVWTNNLVFRNGADYSGTASLTGSNGNILANPLFVDQAAGNYDLLMGSPAIDVGSAVDAPTVDFEGAARVRVVDIGAFEGP